MIKQSSKRFSSLILSVVFLAAALLIYFDLVQSAYGNVQTLKGSQISTQTFLNQEKGLITQAKALIAQYQSESQSQNNLALAMPTGPNVAGALAQVYGIAQANGVAVTGMNVSSPNVQVARAPAAGSPLTASQIIKPKGSLTIQITANGTYEALKSFLTGLETNIRIFDLTAFSIQPAAGITVSTSTLGRNAPPGSVDLFGYTIGVQTYYQLP